MDKGDRVVTVNFETVHLIVRGDRENYQRGITACSKNIITGADWEESLLVPTCPKCIKAEPELCKPETIVDELICKIRVHERDGIASNNRDSRHDGLIREFKSKRSELDVLIRKLSKRNDFLSDLVLKEEAE